MTTTRITDAAAVAAGTADAVLAMAARIEELQRTLRRLVERCDCIALADGSSICTIAEHAVLGDFEDKHHDDGPLPF